MSNKIPTDNNPKKRLSLKREGSEESSPKIEERLHKVLAQAGLGSRRALEERIAQGLVKVNGDTAQVGQSVRSGDRIELDGKTFVASALSEPASVLIYNKPEGQVTTNDDPEGRPTIFESLPRLKGARWIAVGRLDINTTGLLLLTTDGELANALMHPSHSVEREYVCRIHGEVPDNIVDRLARGVALDDGPAKFEKIERIGSSDSHAWFQVVLNEGRNREVRRLWESQGFQVSRLKRVRYGDITLPRLLKRGQCVEMEQKDVDALRTRFKLEDNAPVLTLQPVIGQRKSRPTEIRVDQDRKQSAYVNGHVNDEARELRRFDHVREDKPRGRGRPAGPGRGKPGGGYKGKVGKPFSGPMGADAPHGARPARAGGKPFGKKPFAGPRDDNFGNRADGNTGPRPPKSDRPFVPRGPRPEGGAPYQNRGPRPEGGNAPYQNRGPRPQGEHGNFKPPRGPRPADGNTAEFRSWYVPDGVETGSKVAPPRGPRPQGERPYQNRGPRPEGGNAPYQNRGPRPEGGNSPYQNRGPRPGGANPPQHRGPRPEGGTGPYRGPRPEGGQAPYQNRGPRPQGDRPNENRGPRKQGGPRPPFRKRPDGLPSDD
jgi:23S rRNA pseudouridine2605 synthase